MATRSNGEVASAKTEMPKTTMASEASAERARQGSRAIAREVLGVVRDATRLGRPFDLTDLRRQRAEVEAALALANSRQSRRFVRYFSWPDQRTRRGRAHPERAELARQTLHEVGHRDRSVWESATAPTRVKAV